MSRPPFFTIGIPTYNRAALLGPTIEAALSQSFEDFELLISDNASVDETRSVVAQFKDPRIHYHRNESNIGPVNNFTSMVKKCESTFFVLNQDDDLLHKDFLLRCHQAVKDKPEVTLYGCPMWRENPNRGYTACLLRSPKGFTHRYGLKDEIQYLDGKIFAVRLLDPVYFFLHPAIAMRNETLQQTGGYYSDTRCSADIITTARVLLKGTLAYDPRPGAVFSNHSANASSNMSRAERKGLFQQTFTQLIATLDKEGVNWQSILSKELENYSTQDLFQAFYEWIYYDSPITLQRIGWNNLRKAWPGNAFSFARKCASRLGFKHLGHFLLKNSLQRNSAPK